MSRLLRRVPIADPVARWWASRSPLVKLAVYVAALIVAIFVPTTLSQYWQSVLFFPVGLYIVLALGLNVVVGAAGLLDLGYVAFYAVGAYTTAVLTTKTELTAYQALPAA